MFIYIYIYYIYHIGFIGFHPRGSYVRGFGPTFGVQTFA